MTSRLASRLPPNGDGVQIQDPALNPASDGAPAKDGNGVADAFAKAPAPGGMAADGQSSPAAPPAATDAGDRRWGFLPFPGRAGPAQVIIVDPSVTHYTSVVEALQARHAAQGSPGPEHRPRKTNGSSTFLIRPPTASNKSPIFSNLTKMWMRFTSSPTAQAEMSLGSTAL